MPRPSSSGASQTKSLRYSRLESLRYLHKLRVRKVCDLVSLVAVCSPLALLSAD
jgi:hypothetical protein